MSSIPIVANKVLTLAFVRQQSSILLGLKKKGFGEGRWNGFGGKVEKGETIPAAARRELQEECGLVSDGLKKVGLLVFEFLGDPQLLEVHVFKTDEFTGTVTESDEMKPKWFELNEVPFQKMWPDDILWFPYMLRNCKFYGYFTFKGMTEVVDQTLFEVQSLDEVRIPQGPHQSPHINNNLL